MTEVATPRPGFAARAIKAVIGFYQVGISPRRGASCRYLPTCSEYAAEALTEHGAWQGSYLAARRLLRCHPFHAGGYDPVPEAHPRRDDGDVAVLVTAATTSAGRALPAEPVEDTREGAAASVAVTARARTTPPDERAMITSTSEAGERQC